MVTTRTLVAATRTTSICCVDQHGHGTFTHSIMLDVECRRVTIPSTDSIQEAFQTIFIPCAHSILWGEGKRSSPGCIVCLIGLQFHTGIEGDNTQKRNGENFEIYPWKSWHPFEFCVCIMTNGRENDDMVTCVWKNFTCNHPSLCVCSCRYLLHRITTIFLFSLHGMILIPV